MNFLLDANVRFSVGTFLQSHGHDVRFLAGSVDHGLSDQEVLKLARQESRILITNDKDFGQLIFQRQLDHAGVILFRLSDEARQGFLRRLEAVVRLYGDKLECHFTVVTDAHIRYR